jgi:hypothetical protein
MMADGAFEGLRDVAGKAAENAARIAAVLTIVERPDALTIEAEAMAAACELMTWYLAEALRLSGAHRSPGRPSSLPGVCDGHRSWTGSRHDPLRLQTRRSDATTTNGRRRGGRNRYNELLVRVSF